MPDIGERIEKLKEEVALLERLKELREGIEDREKRYRVNYWPLYYTPCYPHYVPYCSAK